MGHKVNPTGFRIGVIKGWQGRWYADRHYANYLEEDLKKNAAKSRRNARGVDLNRNFDFGYGTGGSGNPCDEEHLGPAPFSEPPSRSVSPFSPSTRTAMPPSPRR